MRLRWQHQSEVGNLRCGNSVSCGCSLRQRRKSWRALNRARQRFSEQRTTAKQRGIEFDMSFLEGDYAGLDINGKPAIGKTA